MSTYLLPLLLVLQAGTTSRPDSAVLRVGARDVFVFRGSLGAATPSERAAAAARRITGAVESGADSVSTQVTAEGVLVLVGGQPVLVITPSDADTAGGESVSQRAAIAVRQLRLAVGEVRESTSLTALLVALALSLLATILLVAAVRLLVAGRHRLDARLERVPVTSRRGFKIRGFTLLRPTQLLAGFRFGVRVLAWGLGLVASYVYVTFVLSQFPWTRPLGQALGHYLVTTLARLGLGALRALPGLFTVVLIFVVTRFLVRLVRTLFEAVERGTLVLPGLHPETAEPTRRIVTALMWMFALIVAYPYLPGSESAAFKGVSVFGGLLLTLGSAGVVGQAMSGLVLMYSRGFKVGDFVQIGNTMGTVVGLGLLSTRVRTTKNEYVTLPNGVVVSGAVTNYSAAQDQAHHLTIYSSVTIGYDAPWRQVHELMIGAAKATEGVRAEPPPFVLQRALNDWYVEYQVNAAIDPQRAPELPGFYSRLHGNIQDAFWAAGVEIMSPSYFAVRDGNTATIPPAHRPKGRSPTFRVDMNPS
ncbi:MAG TPA: mechanosensitive ion channel domain-containing protein [Gemmatimonadales bacterium]|nr:mechanosensitive ion channel domain-containing protein [Gemmatimonadales bacterium]